MLSRRFWTLVVSLGLAFLSCPLVHVQGQSTYGSVTGSVTDQSGAAITNAQVTLTNLGTSDKRVQTTGGDGLYSFVNLNPGQYRIDVEKEGFKHFTQQPVVVEVQQSLRIDAA